MQAAQVRDGGSGPLAVHERATVVNGLAQGSASFEAIVRRCLAGGVSATNLTVAANDSADQAFRKIAKFYSNMDRVNSEQPPGQRCVRVATSVAEIEETKRTGQTAMVLGFQNSDPLEGSLAQFEEFYAVGLRILQLTYQRRNLAADGCGEPGDGGLSTFGRELISSANEMGVLIDLSHVGARSTMEAVDASALPVVATHANLFSKHPIPRNKTDEQIVALAESGGLIGITCVSRLITADGYERPATLAEYVDQIDEVVSLVGPDHVAIGLDIYEEMSAEVFERRKVDFLGKFPELSGGRTFDLDTYFANGLDSASCLPNVTTELLAGVLRRRRSEDHGRELLACLSRGVEVTREIMGRSRSPFRGSSVRFRVVACRGAP